jgi:hypothetical protein
MVTLPRETRFDSWGGSFVSDNLTVLTHPYIKKSILSLHLISLGSKYITQYDNQLSRPYNMSYIDLTSNSVKLLFSFNEVNHDPRRQIQKLEVRFINRIKLFYISFSRFTMKVLKIISMV